jgi:Fur family ferric uptake transcriptional regulator
MISADNQKVKQRIRQFGFRMTPQRQMILEAIGRAGEHATFDEILAQVRAVAPAISRATLYRTLDTFSRNRLIHGNEITGGRVYEVVSDQPHHHLICHNCWSDVHIDGAKVQELFQSFDQQHGFRVLGEHYIFMGLCPHCRQQLGEHYGPFEVHPKFRSTAHKEEQNL